MGIKFGHDPAKLSQAPIEDLRQALLTSDGCGEKLKEKVLQEYVNRKCDPLNEEIALLQHEVASLDHENDSLATGVSNWGKQNQELKGKLESAREDIADELERKLLEWSDHDGIRDGMRVAINYLRGISGA